jgi:hypothetical protein
VVAAGVGAGRGNGTSPWRHEKNIAHSGAPIAIGQPEAIRGAIMRIAPKIPTAEHAARLGLAPV